MSTPTTTPALSTVDDPLLTEQEVETLTRGVFRAVSMRNWRSAGKYLDDLPHVRIANRVYYRQSVIEQALTNGVGA